MRPQLWHLFGRAAPALLPLALLAGPSAARASPLLEEELSLRPTPRLRLAAAQGDPSLDFDLLGKPKAPVLTIDDAAMKRRRWMLNLHQTAGLGLVALGLATTVVGQLNYLDKYGSNAPVTGRYQLTHAVLAYTTLGVFAVNGTIALLAPSAPRKKEGFDRMTIHKAGMAVAAAGMVAQAVVGIHAREREGRLDQASAARLHLAIGYATLAAFSTAVGALVF